jgi:E3 ubiquitin-protein ligase TRIP12
MFHVVQIFFIYLPLIFQIFEIVILADNLLPHMPAIIIELPTYYHAYKDSSTNKSASIKQEGAGSTGNEKSGNERLLRDQPKLLEQFGMDLLPTMTQVSTGILP